MATLINAWAAEESHLSSLIGLGRTYYENGHPVLTEEFLTWLYIKNPAGRSHLVVAHEEGLWIGLIALIPVMLECPGGRLQEACYAVNVLTHPEHRGKNLFVKMIAYARDLLSSRDIWLLGHPNANAIPGWKRQRMEFREPLNAYFAKFRLPFSSLREDYINNLQQLQAIPSDFWNGLLSKHAVHLKYTPEFIAWRFLDAPHRKYTVSAVYRRKEFLGLRVTRRFKGPVELMVDFVGPIETLGDLLSSVGKPTLIMHPRCGGVASEINKGSWKLPMKRKIPFFVTTWKQTSDFDMTGITLAASDF